MKISAGKLKPPQQQPPPGRTTLRAEGRLDAVPQQHLADRKSPEHQLPETKGKDLDSRLTASSRHVQDFSWIPLHSKARVGSQPQFTVNAPGNVQEERPKLAIESRDETSEDILEIQKKSLGASDPNDADENEADEVSQKVVHGHSAEARGSARTSRSNTPVL